MKVELIDYDKDTKRIVCTNDDGSVGSSLIENKDIELFGENYIKNNMTMEYINCFKAYYCKLNLEPYYNSLDKFPEKTIEVEFMGKIQSQNACLFRAKNNGRFYIRDFIEDQRYATWSYAGKTYNKNTFDEIGIRANIIFNCNGEKEKITYSNWNGEGVYSQNYNEYFTKLYHDSKKKIKK